MSRLFKEYDKKFQIHAGTALKRIKALQGSIAREDIDSIKRWDTGAFGPYVVYEQVKVQWAVYEHASHEDWQKFRVSLKGLSTKEKLYCLAHRLSQYDKAEPIYRIELIRANNYLGALIRGGQLNANLEVVR